MKTKYKILIAKIILKILIFFKVKLNQNVKRNNINWKLDLNEGIDLSIYIFGNFERELLNVTNKLSFKKIDNIIDIGSNIGAHTFQFAKNYKSTKVYSIEPTDFAFEKLRNNLKINNNFKYQIQIFQYFLGENHLPSQIYSSWSLLGDEKSHYLHKGILKSTKNAKSLSLDEFVSKYKIKGNTLIKCDVDGYELEVLRSGKNFLKKNKPHIIMELAPYLYNENGYNKKDIFNFFERLGYKFYNATNYYLIENIYNYSKKIKIGSSENIFLK